MPDAAWRKKKRSDRFYRLGSRSQGTGREILAVCVDPFSGGLKTEK